MTTVTTVAPPLFLAAPGAADTLPCANTGYPIIPLVSLDTCAIEPVEDSRGEPMDLYICANG